MKMIYSSRDKFKEHQLIFMELIELEKKELLEHQLL